MVDAIDGANLDAPIGNCPAGSGADTITLPANSTQRLIVANDTDLLLGATGLPPITTAITIQGNGSTILRAPGAPNFRLLRVGAAGDLTLVGTTLSGGNAAGLLLLGNGGGVTIASGGVMTVIDSNILSDTAALLGGGVFNAGVLNIIASTVAN